MVLLSIDINPKIIKSLTLKLTLPEPNITFYERAFQFLLDNEEILTKEQKDWRGMVNCRYRLQVWSNTDKSRFVVEER